MQARRGWQIFKVMESKGLQSGLLCASKLSIRIEGQKKCFPDRVKLKEFIITKCLLYEMLMGLVKEKKIKTMNIKMTTNSQLLTTESKMQKQKQTKQTTRTGTESQKWRSHGGLSLGRGRGEWGKRYRD